MKFTNFSFFVGHFWPPGAWIRIHNTACMVAVVMNRNVNYIRKVLYIVVCSPLSCHQILRIRIRYGSGSSNPKQYGSSRIQIWIRNSAKTAEGTATLSVNVFTYTFYKVLRYWYLPLYTLSHVVTLCDSTGSTIYTGD
jgi:hypothetical protein